MYKEILHRNTIMPHCYGYQILDATKLFYIILHKSY